MPLLVTQQQLLEQYDSTRGASEIKCRPLFKAGQYLQRVIFGLAGLASSRLTSLQHLSKEDDNRLEEPRKQKGLNDS